MLEAEQVHQKFELFHKNDSKRPTGWIIGAVVFLILISVTCIILASFEIAYKDKFFPGSKIGSVDLSGLTKEEARVVVSSAIDKLDNNSVTVKLLGGEKERLVMLDFPLSADAAHSIINMDLDKTINDNFKIGHGEGFITNLLNQYLLAGNIRKMSAAVTVDRAYLIDQLNSQLSAELIASSNAKPDIKCSNDKCEIFLINEVNGWTYDFDKGINEWQWQLSSLNSSFIKLQKTSKEPDVKRIEAESLLPELENIFVASGTPIIKYEQKTWVMKKDALAQMIGFEKVNSRVVISVDQLNFNKWFAENISKEIDIEARDAMVEMASGTISKLSAQQSGKKANMERAFSDLSGFYKQGKYSEIVIDLQVDVTEPTITMDNISDIGVTEIIGIGESNFAGSPTNRRKNIKNGAAKLHGKLIKPGEEFSVMQNVMPVDAENGYFTELVIKGNKTTAEYGGGLCQIGTTMFRAALASGLPIIERTNHSYNVTYYLENGLPGVDATIYDPKPDMKFKNDTGNYILIQARIVGDKLYFEFWGTKDGRTASRTKPKVWGWKSPAPTKLIETLDLKPGVKKCTEVAHKGVSASFDYIVNYADGNTATSTFTSVYRPWQEVCLIGVSSLSASSTTSE